MVSYAARTDCRQRAALALHGNTPHRVFCFGTDDSERPLCSPKRSRAGARSTRDVLQDFAVLAPDLGDGDLVNKIAESIFPLPRLIVWLDQLQRFLDGPYLTPGSVPITPAAVRRLLDVPTPVIIVGTLWPSHASQLRATEIDPVMMRRAWQAAAWSSNPIAGHPHIGEISPESGK